MLALQPSLPTCRVNAKSSSSQCRSCKNVRLQGSSSRSFQRGSSHHRALCATAASQRTVTRGYRRLDVQAVIPMLSGDATDQTPPDLPSFLFKERIVYLGMSLVPSVTELLLAEFMYLQYDDSRQPVYLYINSTGVQKGADKLGYEAEAFAIYDTMRFVKPPVGTVCVGSAYGEAAMLLAAGEKGKRAALPSSTIMLRQPIQQFAQMQASDIDIYRNEIRKTNANIVKVLSKHTEHDPEKIANDIKSPKYFDPQAAKDYNIIDRVLESSELENRDVLREASKFA